jgi:intracellular septation protein
VAPVEHGVDLMLETRADFSAIGERQQISGQHQGGAHERLAELLEQHLRHRMSGDTDPDRATPLVLEPSRRLARGRQKKGVRTWRAGLQQPELRRIDARVAGDFRQIPAHQREMVVPIGLADTANALERSLVAKVAAQCVTGIGGVRDHSARAHDLRRTTHQAPLWVYRMQLEVFAHAGAAGSFGYHPTRRMQSMLEIAPLLAFLAAYYADGLYTATAVLMAAMALLLGVDYVRTRRIPPMHALSAGLVFAFGTATLLLNDQRFIQWKPTVFFWLVSAAFLGSFWIGKRTLVERFLGSALGAEARVEPALWRRLNGLWVVFYAVLGGLNLAVAFHASERTWVNFKVFGLTILTLAFVAGQLFWLFRRTSSAASA